MKRLRLVQLPVPPPAALAATGNVPLAAGCLGVAARVHGLDQRLKIEVVSPGITDAYGDTRLAELIAKDEPEFLGLSLYLWNSERSLHLAREVKRRSPRTTVLIGGPEGLDARCVERASQRWSLSRLTLPHPELFNRGFVLVPLAEIASDMRIGGKSVRDAAKAMPDEGIFAWDGR